MKKSNPLFVLLLCLIGYSVWAQPVSVYQFRKVEQDKIGEFIHRETTYWSQVAKKAIDDGKLSAWILFQKVGGADLENASNFLFINTFPDINVEMGDIWNPSKVFPDISSSQISTDWMGTVTAQAFVRPNSWVDGEGAVPSEHYNFVKFNYWNTTNPNQFVSLEDDHWKPFIDKAMAMDGTNQVAWGNAVILNPRGPNVPGNTISFDVYPTLKDVLLPNYPEGTTFPEEGLGKLAELVTSRTEVLYRVVMAVTDNN